MAAGIATEQLHLTTEDEVRIHAFHQRAPRARRAFLDQVTP